MSNGALQLCQEADFLMEMKPGLLPGSWWEPSKTVKAVASTLISMICHRKIWKEVGDA